MAEISFAWILMPANLVFHILNVNTINKPLSLKMNHEPLWYKVTTYNAEILLYFVDQRVFTIISCIRVEVQTKRWGTDYLEDDQFNPFQICCIRVA